MNSKQGRNASIVLQEDSYTLKMVYKVDLKRVKSS